MTDASSRTNPGSEETKTVLDITFTKLGDGSWACSKCSSFILDPQRHALWHRGTEPAVLA